MNGTYLYEAMGGIRPVYVEEAEKQPFAKPFWRKALPLAACMMIVVGLSLWVLQITNLMPALPTIPQFPAYVQPHNNQLQTALRDELYYQDDFCLIVLNRATVLLGISCFLVPLICLIRKRKPRLTHILSCILYLSYLMVCIGTVWYCVSQQWWGTLYSELPDLFRNSLILLLTGLLTNGLHYLKKQKLAVFLALASCTLFLLEPPLVHDLIDNADVASVETDMDAQTLLELMEQSGGRRTIPIPLNHPNHSGVEAVITMDDGSYYTLSLIYINTFSFRPGNFGADDYEYLLIAFNSSGRATGDAWTLDYRFDDAMKTLSETGQQPEVTP